MGVGIAWPNSKFEPQTVEIKRIADSADSWPEPPEPAPAAPEAPGGGLLETIQGWFGLQQHTAGLYLNLTFLCQPSSVIDRKPQSG